MIEVFITNNYKPSPSRIDIIFFSENNSLLKIQFPKNDSAFERQPIGFYFMVKNNLKTNKQLNLAYIQDEEDRYGQSYD